jgi:hypothetical protein
VKGEKIMKIIRCVTFIPKFIILALFQVITFICALGVIPFAMALAIKKRREDPSLAMRTDILTEQVYNELDPAFCLRFFDNTLERLKAWTFCRPINPEKIH